MINIIYQDDAFMVLDKPPGIVVTSSETQPFDDDLGKKVPTLEDILKTDFQIKVERGGVVHRLDKDTSGILVIAKTPEALNSLQEQFKSRTVSKQYLTLVHGWITENGRVEAAIGRNPGDREKFVVFEEKEMKLNPFLNIREAITEYQPSGNFQFSISNFQKIFEGFNKIQFRKLERANYNNFTLLKCFPLTGRTHQIRVHLKYIGHSVVGDDKYGGRKTSRLDKRWCSRQFLHAARLEINHPLSGERLVFESPLPEDLEKVLGLLSVKN